LNLRVTVLGSGTSHGVPAIGCDCAVCRSTDPRDRRTRPSILIELRPDAPRPPLAEAVGSILVDTSTDLRAQALANDVRRVDAILFTHGHADHVLGLDETRRYNEMQQTPIGCYANASTVDGLRRMFSYIFAPSGQSGGGIPELRLFSIAGAFTMGGAEIVPIPLFHGELPVLGFRVGPFAYLTDCNRIPEESWPLLTGSGGIRVLLIDALRESPHPTHFNVSQALDVVSRIKPERTYFTHICHDLSHQATCARLPPGVQLAYDGLVLEIGERRRETTEDTEQLRTRATDMRPGELRDRR
jgi:phosphoribosyl 1,2-cyclic phosphate phosphodiesterase